MLLAHRLNCCRLGFAFVSHPLRCKNRKKKKNQKTVGFGKRNFHLPIRTQKRRFIQCLDFKGHLFQSTTSAEAEGRGLIFKGNQHTVIPLDKKENRWVLRALYNLSSPAQESIRALFPFENPGQLYLNCPKPIFLTFQFVVLCIFISMQ